MSVPADRREGFLLNRCGAQLDALQHAGVEDVDTSIDTVSNEFDRFLDETVNSRSMVWLVDNDTIFRGLFDFRYNDGTLVSMGFVESS